MLSLALSLVALPLLSSAHMTPWMPSMYGVGENFAYAAGNPVDPIGPGWTTQDDWWFRGPSYRALKPKDGVYSSLPAGGSITMEIACHVAWTSYGWSTTEPGSELDACPGSNAGPYHAGDPNSMEIEDDLISGCALAIADVEDIEDVTMDNLVVFSVNQNCIKQKMTTFEVPAKMPKCTGDHCICSWHWLANRGTANFYQTGFRCKVDGSPVDATPIAPPNDPVFCKNDPSSCTAGAKRPIYAYNYPSNVPWIGNDDRAGYHAAWSFPNNGAQNDIFLAAGQTVNSTSSSSNTTSVANPWFGKPTGAGGAPDLAMSVSTVTSSSTSFGQGPWHTVDGWVDGYKADGSGNYEQEWSSNGQGVGAWVNLVWKSPVTLNQVVLFDRPNLDDQVTSANITFSDGSFVTVGSLANDGSATYLNLSSSVTTSSLRFTVLGVSSSTSNVGLAEIMAFSVSASGFTSTTSVQGVARVASSSVASSTVVSSAPLSSASVVQNVTSSSIVLSAPSTLASSSTYDMVTPPPQPTSTSALVSSAAQSSSASISQVSSVVNSSADSTRPDWRTSSTVDSSSSIADSPTSTLVSSTVVSSSIVASSSGSAASSLHLIASVPSTVSSTVSASSSSIVSSLPVSSSTIVSSAKVSSSVSSSIVSSSISTTSSAAAPSSTLTNLARRASATASSYTIWTGQYPRGAIDGIVGGYHIGGSYYTTQEWASNGQKAGAWFQLAWGSPQTFNQIVLWDRPNMNDQVLAGNVTFADGTGVSFTQLPNDAKTGLTLNFANTVSTSSFRVYITQVSSSTKNAGLSEVQVFLADASKFSSTVTATRVALAAVAPTVASSSVVSSAAKTSSSASVAPTVVPNPKSAPASSSSAAQSTVAAPVSSTSSQATSTSSGVVWTRVTNVARAILAEPIRKRSLSYSEELVDTSLSNGTRHVRDFRPITE